jgi:hypothetical protein
MRAFGQQPENWKALSPILQLHQSLPAFLAVCSTTRPDQPCYRLNNLFSKHKNLGHPHNYYHSHFHIEINRSLRR